MPLRTSIALVGLILLVLPGLSPAQARDADPGAAPIFQKDDRVIILGNTFAERMQHFGYFEALLQYHHADLDLTLRNLGWSGDEVALMPRPLDFGDLETHLQRLEADVILLCFGANEAFAGAAGLEKFEADYRKLIERLESGRFNGETAPRLVFVSPIAHENLGPPWPDGASHNESLEVYSEVIEKLAKERGAACVDLFTPSRAMMRETGELTINGIHLNDEGYRRVAREMGIALGMEAFPWEKLEGLRELVIEKNRQFFFRWRPVNAEYVFGRRKEPFGVISYPPEMAEWDRLVAEKDAEILARAKSLAAARGSGSGS